MLKYIKKDKYLDMPDLINLLIQKKFKIGVFPIYEKWLDVGSHESLSKAKKFF